MHSVTLINVNVPHVEEEPEKDTKIQEEIEKLEEVQKTSPTYLTRYRLSCLYETSNAFARKVLEVIDETLEPYSTNTENEDYLEIVDYTGDVENEYETRTVNCIKRPDGKILQEYYDKSIHGLIVRKDGKVYEIVHLGDVSYYKRTKKAKKHTAIQNYPVSSLYTLQEYGESLGYNYDEKTRQFYLTENPNGIFDWYSIGGRWPTMLLVKEDCKEFSYGTSYGYEAPEGYKWVSAARKKDICWDVMMNFKKDKLIKVYNELVKCFEEQKISEEIKKEYYNPTITEEGIKEFNYFPYKKGETAEEFLTHKVFDESLKLYPAPSIFIDQDSELFEEYDYENTEDWHNTLINYIDNIDDDEVIAVIDMHC